MLAQTIYLNSLMTLKTRISKYHLGQTTSEVMFDGETRHGPAQLDPHPAP